MSEMSEYEIKALADQWLDASGDTLPLSVYEQAVVDIAAAISLDDQGADCNRMGGPIDRVLTEAVAAVDAEGERVRRECQMSGSSKIGRFKVRPNGEFICHHGTDEVKARQLRDWPASDSWYVELVSPDGSEEVYGPELGSWAGLIVAAEELAREQDRAAAMRLESARLSLRASAAKVSAAERAVAEAQEARDEVIRMALERGVSAVDVARITGLTKGRVYQIRRG